MNRSDDSPPARGPLTEEQIERLRDMAAYGPLTRRPIDASLEAAGWLEPYDGLPDAVELIPGRARMLFDSKGRVRAHWEGAS